MLQRPIPHGLLATLVHLLDHLYVEFLGYLGVFRPYELLDETLLHAEDRVKCNILAVMRVQCRRQADKVWMLNYEVLVSLVISRRLEQGNVPHELAVCSTY